MRKAHDMLAMLCFVMIIIRKMNLKNHPLFSFRILMLPVDWTDGFSCRLHSLRAVYKIKMWNFTPFISLDSVKPFFESTLALSDGLLLQKSHVLIHERAWCILRSVCQPGNGVVCSTSQSSDVGSRRCKVSFLFLDVACCTWRGGRE